MRILMLLGVLGGCDGSDKDTPTDSHTGTTDTSGTDSSDTGETPGTGETGETGATGDTGATGFDTGACVDADGDLHQPEAVGCATAGGVCISDPAACSEGQLLPEHDAECAFDDGPGYCCRPPDPVPTGDTCAASGGVCAPIAGCGMVAGWFTPYGDECTAAYGIPSICCAPTTACEGGAVVTCCSDDGLTAFVANCDRGTLVCPIGGTSLTCEQDCPAFDL